MPALLNSRTLAEVVSYHGKDANEFAVAQWGILSGLALCEGGQPNLICRLDIVPHVEDNWTLLRLRAGFQLVLR